MANILAYIEIQDSKATALSLQGLNVGRQLATELGATLYALLPCVEPPSYEDDDIIAILSRHGADKVILLSHPQLTPPAFYATHGQALLAACRQFVPRLLFFPDSVEGRELAPRLAMALRASYFPDGALVLAEGGYRLQRQAYRRQFRVAEPLHHLKHTEVVTLRDTGQTPVDLGDEEAEVVVVHAPVDSSPPLQLLGEEPHPGQAITICSASNAPEDLEEPLAELAQRIGAVSLKLPPSPCTDREAGCVGVDGQAIESSCLLAAGFDGSEAFLCGVAPHTTMVALGCPEDGLLTAVADHQLQGDAGQQIDLLLALLAADPAEESQ